MHVYASVGDDGWHGASFMTVQQRSAIYCSMALAALATGATAHRFSSGRQLECLWS